MEAQFWIDSWHIGGAKTSFHRRDIHPYLYKHLPPATLQGKRVLAPLCGKTLDLLYFRDHAAHVIGVELVEMAVQQFFAEHDLPFVQRGNRYEAERLTLICGDFFALTPADVGPLHLSYDRASLVALPLPMRLRYIQQVQALLPVGGQQFVNTLEYAPLLPEPPFSITPEEVAAYYGATHQIQHLEAPLLPDHGMVRKFGLTYLKEHGFLLTKQAAARLN
ncbi:MAG: thiopurine S-methyltransferase [Caldilinea sp. CFX5]|nr:thiopurine S-methyltransferase [Caldilinea sp. CFX5]